jgi:hypothetical protein
MKRPLNSMSENLLDMNNYIEQLEKYCDYLETALKANKKQCDYWCTKATETKALYREQVKETARVRRERTA